MIFHCAWHILLAQDLTKNYKMCEKVIQNNNYYPH